MPTPVQNVVAVRNSNVIAKRHIRPRLSEDALWPDDQHDDQHREPDRDLPARLDEERRPLDQQAEHDAGGKCAEDIADPAEHDRGEDREQEAEAELGPDVGNRSREHAREAREPAREEPRVEDHPRGVDAGGFGEVEVVGQRAHPLSEQRESHHCAHREHHRYAYEDHDQLGAPDSQPEEFDGGEPVDVEKADLAAPHVLDAVPDQEREPDRHQQKLQQAGVAGAHRRPHDALEQHSEQRRHHDRE